MALKPEEKSCWKNRRETTRTYRVIKDNFQEMNYWFQRLLIPFLSFFCLFFCFNFSLSKTAQINFLKNKIKTDPNHLLSLIESRERFYRLLKKKGCTRIDNTHTADHNDDVTMFCPASPDWGPEPKWTNAGAMLPHPPPLRRVHRCERHRTDVSHWLYYAAKNKPKSPT